METTKLIEKQIDLASTENAKHLLMALASYRSRKKTISRQMLAYIIGISDRRLRQLIGQARKKSAIPICFDPVSGGYFISYEPSDVERLIAEYRSRATDEWETAKALEVHIPRKTDLNQVTIDEVS